MAVTHFNLFIIKVGLNSYFLRDFRKVCNHCQKLLKNAFEVDYLNCGCFWGDIHVQLFFSCYCFRIQFSKNREHQD